MKGKTKEREEEEKRERKPKINLSYIKIIKLCKNVSGYYQ
tara:strand:+ start:1157 stop:1276 length:120 start_codon:yes stop_codon:yes gene_type:complete